MSQGWHLKFTRLKVKVFLFGTRSSCEAIFCFFGSKLVHEASASLSCCRNLPFSTHIILHTTCSQCLVLLFEKNEKLAYFIRERP